jgi:hypothetical protein
MAGAKLTQFYRHGNGWGNTGLCCDITLTRMQEYAFGNFGNIRLQHGT